MAIEITAEDIIMAIKTVDAERHPAHQLGWFDYSMTEMVTIDGDIDFDRLAEELTKIAIARK